MIDKKKPVYLIKQMMVKGLPVALNPDGRPINEDKFLMGTVDKHSEYFSNSKYEGLKAHANDIERLLNRYVEKQVQLGIDIDTAKNVANLRYSRKLTRAIKKLKL